MLPKAAPAAAAAAAPAARDPVFHSPSARHWLLAAAIGAAYLAISFAGVDRPGLHYDEAFPASFAYKTLHPETPWQLPYGGPASFGGHGHGPLRAYLTVPWLAVFPFSPASLRALGILTGLAALAMVFLLAGRWFGGPAGCLAAGLLALDPAFVFQVRDDMHVNGLLLCVRLGSLWAVDRLWSGGRWRAGAALGILSLAGLWTTAEHFWFLGGLLAAAALVGQARWRRHLRENAWLPWAALPLVAWALFFAYADSANPEPLTPDFLRRVWRAVSELRVDEALRRLRLVGNTFNANAVETFFLDGPLAGRWLPFWELLAPAAAVFLLGPLRPWSVDTTGRQTRKFFLLCLPFFSLVLLVLTPPVYGPHHVLAMYPFLHMFVAVSLADVWPRGAGWRLASAALLAFYLAGAARELTAFHRRFAAGRAEVRWSGSVAEAAAALREAGEPAVCLDWGLGHNLAVLTRGRVPLREIRRDRREGFRTYGYSEAWSGLFARPGTLYLLHGEGFEVDASAREDFFALAKEFGRSPRLVKTVARDGRPFIQIYAAPPKPR